MEDRAGLANDVARSWTTWDYGRKARVIRCMWCGDEMPYGFDLHEAFVKRNAIKPEFQHLIMVKENCFPVHHACHIGRGQSKEMTRRCLKAVARGDVIELSDVGRWYVRLWGKYGLPLAKGMLIPRKSLPMSQAIRMMEYGATGAGVDWPTDEAVWLVDGGSAGKWDYRALVVHRWSKSGKKGFRKPAEEWADFEYSQVVRHLEDGYWLTYLSRVLGLESPEAVLA